MRRTAWATLFVLLASAPAWAQGRFVAGPFQWTPTVELRDVGIDDNVFDDPKGLEREDRTSTVGTNIAVAIDAPRFKFSGSARLDYVYFEKFESERAFNRAFSARVERPFNRFEPFFAGGFTKGRERQGFEVDLRADREERSLSGGATIHLSTRGQLQGGLRVFDRLYAADQIFRGIELADELDQYGRQANIGLRYAVTPLTAVRLDVRYGQERFYVSPGKNADTWDASIGLQFEPDAVIRGDAIFGYKVVDTKDPGTIPFRGFTAAVDLAYIFLESTRFDGRYSRETAVSIEAPYYVQSQYGLEITQNFIGPVNILARGTRQKLDYKAIPSRQIGGRKDFIDIYGIGFAVRTSDRTRFTINYDTTRRRSVQDALVYLRHRLMAAVFVGI